METNKPLPIFQFIIDANDELNTGVTGISLVSSPANEVSFQTFKKATSQKFSITDKSKRIVTGAVIIPNLLMYRKDANGFEYEGFFSPDSVESIVQRFFQNDNEKNVNLEHSLKVSGATLFESFIYDAERNSPPKGFETLPEKTWFVSYKITDDILWQSILDGKIFSGFSLEGFFNRIPIKLNKTKKTPLDILNELIQLLEEVEN